MVYVKVLVANAGYPCYYVIMKIGFIGLGNMGSGMAKNQGLDDDLIEAIRNSYISMEQR